MVKRRSKKRKKLKIVAPFVLGSLLFLATRPLLVTAVADEVTTATYFLDELEVETEVGENGFMQITTNIRGQKNKLTESGYSHRDPEADQEYIVWRGQVDKSWQIFLFHFPSGTEIQLTKFGNNVNPDVSGNYVVWEGQVDGVWQIFLYDGLRIKQITDGDQPKQDVSIEGKYIVYTQKTLDGVGWHIYIYNIDAGTHTNLTPNMYSSKPNIENGQVTWYQVVGEMKLVYQYDISTGDTHIPGQADFDVDAYRDYIESVESSITPALEVIEEGLAGVPDTVSTLDVQEELGVDVTQQTEEVTEEVVESTQSTQSAN